jgi:hypothetical protein
MVTAGSSETLIPIYQNTCHILEYRNINFKVGSDKLNVVGIPRNSSLNYVIIELLFLLDSLLRLIEEYEGK